MQNEKFCVIGAGSWGTALALVLARQGKTVYLWAKDPEHLNIMAKARQNERYLPRISFPPSLHLAPSLEAACTQSSEILIAVPSHAFAEVLTAITPYLKPEQGLTWATKGLDPSARFLHELVLEQTGPRPMALITGPSFAKEVAEGLPTAVIVASNSAAYGAKIKAFYETPYFRIYQNDDLLGAELGGAVKNVLALAVGIATGLGFGTNTKAALITRGLSEMMRLGEALGAKRETLIGLSGLGDLILTCSDTQSRNLRFGILLGEGVACGKACLSIGQVVESIHTAKLLHSLAQKHKVRMPISEQVFEILHQGVSPEIAISKLLHSTASQE